MLGLDISPSMLDLAKRKYHLLTNQDKGHCSFVYGDIRSFQTPEALPLVIFPYNSISHLISHDDLTLFFTNLKKNLLYSGKFVFTVFVPLPGFLSRDPNSLFPVGCFRNSQTLKQIELFETMAYDKSSQVNHITWYFFEEDKDEPYITQLKLRMFFPQELIYLLDYFGFEIEQRYGDYDLSPFERDSVVQCIVARIKR